MAEAGGGVQRRLLRLAPMRSLLLVAVLLVVGCGNDSPTAPTPPPFTFTGTWAGSVTWNVEGLGPGMATVTITQTGTALSGTWATTYSDATRNSGGAFEGTATGMALSGRIFPGDPNLCPSTVNGTVRGDVMTGTHATYDCSVTAAGTLTLTRQ